MEIRTIRGVFTVWILKTGIYEVKSPYFFIKDSTEKFFCMCLLLGPIFFSLGSKKWQFSDFRAEKNESELKQNGHEPSQAEKTSARAMARASSARAHHYELGMAIPCFGEIRNHFFFNRNVLDMKISPKCSSEINIFIRGFTKFGIKVLWRLPFFIGYRTLNFKVKLL